MTKVPRCKGSYQKRKSGEGWQIKYPLGWSEEKLKYDEYREEFSSEAEAIAALKDINDFIYHGGKKEEVAVHRGKAVIVAAAAEELPTVEAFIKTFCKIRRDQGKVSERTLVSDWDCLGRAIPYIGSLRIDEVKPLHIDEMYAAMKRGDERNRTNKPYSGTTIQKTHCALSMLFSKAIDYEYIEKNPCDKVDKPKRDTEEKVHLTAIQANELHQHIVKNGLEARAVGVLIALHTGVRLSEMLALNWEDCVEDYIVINKSQCWEKQTTKETKNGESRVVPCPLPLRIVLEEWRETQKAWYKERGLKWSEKCPIVNSTVGNHVLQRSYEKWFSEALKGYPVPEGFTYHGLRHTYTSLMSVECLVADKTTQVLTGHKSYQSHAIYLHAELKHLREAAGKYSELFVARADKKLCLFCAHWMASPNDSAVGSCWRCEGCETVPVTKSFSECMFDAFELKKSA